jgi:hypothetical protein
MMRSVTRFTMGVVGLGLLASVTAGCKAAQVPPDMMARVEAAANKAEAAANKAEASARSASDAAMRAEAAAAKAGSGFTRGLHK